MRFTNRLKNAYYSLIHPEKLGGSIFYPVKSKYHKEQNILKDFEEIPELNAVINWKARAFSNMNLRVVSKTTGEIVENDISTLLRQPNWWQGQGEFLKQTKLFHDIFGNEFLYFLSTVGFNTVKAFYTMPPQNMEVCDKNELPFFMSLESNLQYNFTWKGKEYTLDPEKIIHLNDNNVNINSENYVLGKSKIESLKDPLKNIRASYNARGVNLYQNGPMGIISSAARDGAGSIPLLPEDKEQVQKELRTYGALENQFKYIVTSNALDFTPISADTEKLLAFEEVREDFDKIMDAYGLTKDIFSSAENSTFENKKEAEKQAYQNTIIPEATEWIAAINKKFDTGNKPYVIVGDYWHLPVFKENMQETANTLQTLTNSLSTQLADGVITVDEYKEKLNEFYEKK